MLRYLFSCSNHSATSTYQKSPSTNFRSRRVSRIDFCAWRSGEEKFGPTAEYPADAVAADGDAVLVLEEGNCIPATAATGGLNTDEEVGEDIPNRRRSP